MELAPAVRQKVLRFQQLELTEHEIYRRLAQRLEDGENRRILLQIAEDELRHARDWEKITGQTVKPKRLWVWFYSTLARLLGLTFGLKLMERGEERAQRGYQELVQHLPQVEAWIRDEDEHEHQLLGMLEEERLHYAGSVVLGLNDALVELTGALAGLTLALQNTKLIALSGLITGIAASLSMAASEYLSTRAEGTEKHPLRAAIYTGIAYIFTVILLVLPYLLFANYYLDLALTLAVALCIIAVFNFYIAVAKDEPFGRRFGEMALLSFSVAAFSFAVGFVARRLLGVDV
ncbi:MAG: VIT1/CCC1 transporter family protein [Thermoanaerobaculum sp.]|nr:VIT1/CCC1 transporter family protein [Thermoanaerobaculum sp.]MDW7967737.1 VIT1/CCC1 transporter family protein [Thermoanaerobaculum sp.]